MAKTANRMTRRDRRIARHVRLAMDYERGLESDLRKIFAKAGRDAANHVAAGDAQYASHAGAAYQDAIRAALRGRLLAAAEASAALIIEELTGQKSASGLETKFLSLLEIARRAIVGWIDQHAAEKVRRVTDSIRRTIQGSIKRGNEQDEPPRVLAKRIREDTSGEIGRARALTIARTETHNAASVGSDAAANATGLQIVKEWAATEDQRTRPAHASADGQTVDRDADFIVGGERMAFPGDQRGSAWNVINCRCVVLYHPKATIRQP